MMYSVFYLFIKFQLSSVLNSKALHLVPEKNNQDIINILFSQKGIQICNECFMKCKHLTQINIPSVIKSIPNYAFTNCYL